MRRGGTVYIRILRVKFAPSLKDRVHVVRSTDGYHSRHLKVLRL